MAINKDLEIKIVRKIFTDAASLGWLNLTSEQRSEMYQKWVDDPEVGGRLTSFLAADKVRLWIKDGPMKEYARSIYGVGKYADLVSNPALEIDHLVARTLGPGWEIEENSRKIKPLRVTIAKDGREKYFCWALGKDPKHLIWAAIKAEADNDPIPWVLCLVGSFENPITPDERDRNLRYARHCDLRLEHVDGR